jgi:hypothetical protein
MNDLFLVVGLVIVGLVVLVFGLGALLVLLADTRGAAYGTGRLAARVIKGVVVLVVLGVLFTLNTLIVTALGLDPYAGAIKSRRGDDVSPLLLLIALASFVEFGILYSLRGRFFGRGGAPKKE